MTADEGSEELLAAPPLLEQLFSEGGITRGRSQQSCRHQAPSGIFLGDFHVQ